MTDQPTVPFKAETRQLLEILIHSLYTEREVFLRELISNASDALTRMNYVMLTDRNVIDPEAALGIWVTTRPDENIIVIRDTGDGMTAEELAENLGTIAHSGAKAFIEAVQQGHSNLKDMIGQFGVGFYSAFMVADWIRVTSRSYHPDSTAAAWYSTGEDTYRIEPAEKAERGTIVEIKLKDDAGEYVNEPRLKEIIARHSNYIPFPIYVGEQTEQANRQSAIWRQSPRQVKEEEYGEFYQQFSMDFSDPLMHLHLSIDAPVQVYALLYVPASMDKPFFATRKQDGLALYARKILIQEYNRDLLPEYFRFVQGVVDSEDIPLNVSRESVQSTRVMASLKKVLTGKLIDGLKNLDKEKTEAYQKFWQTYGPFVKEGVAADPEYSDALIPLLRYHTVQFPTEWKSLADYVQGMKTGQEKIYYLVGDDERSIQSSPHLEAFRRLGYDVILMTEPMDSFTLLRLKKYADFDLADAGIEDIQLPKDEEHPTEISEEDAGDQSRLVERFKQQLGEKVTDVRISTRLVESPARLADSDGAAADMARVYKYLQKDYEAPKKILELNPRHPILANLAALPEEDPRLALLIEQVFENALLIEGLHPNPAGMIARIQEIMEAALKKN